MYIFKSWTPSVWRILQPALVVRYWEVTSPCCPLLRGNQSLLSAIERQPVLVVHYWEVTSPCCSLLRGDQSLLSAIERQPVLVVCYWEATSPYCSLLRGSANGRADTPTHTKDKTVNMFSTGRRLQLWRQTAYWSKRSLSPLLFKLRTLSTYYAKQIIIKTLELPTSNSSPANYHMRHCVDQPILKSQLNFKVGTEQKIPLVMLK